MKPAVLLLSSVFALSALVPVRAHAGGTLTIPKKVPFKTSVPAAVKAECNLEKLAAENIRDAVKGAEKVQMADHVSKATAGRALEMSITGILATGGGSWSGPKSVTIEGALWNGGKLVGRFKARRNTMGGGYGTCGMLQRDLESIAEDIAEWLKAPKDKALLGDA